MARQPHILFIMTDQQRVDHVGWHPDSRMQLPHLQELANGQVFQNCVTVNPICTPTRCALLTGRYTRQIGMLAMSGDLSRDIPTYPQALQKAGYHTVGIGKFHWLQTWKWNCSNDCGVDADSVRDDLLGYGFDQVWEAAGKQLAQHNYCDWSRQLHAKGVHAAYKEHVMARGRNFTTAQQTEFTGEAWPFDEEDYVDCATGDQVIKHLRERPQDKPWFGFASFCGPHAPFDPPQRFLDMVPEEQDEPFVSGGPDDSDMDADTKAQLRRLRRAYKAMLLCIDEQVGRIIAELKAQNIFDDTVIIFTSDHGEMMGDHGFFQKSRPQWQSATVPLAIRHPDHLTGQSHDSLVEITDITATILDCAGLDPQKALSKDWPAFNNIIPSRSLLPMLSGEQAHIRTFAFSECNRHWHMIQSSRYKYIRYPHERREYLFDRNADPDECTDLSTATEHREAMDTAREQLLCVLEDHPACQSRWAPLTAPDGSDDYPVMAATSAT